MVDRPAPPVVEAARRGWRHVLGFVLVGGLGGALLGHAVASQLMSLLLPIEAGQGWRLIALVALPLIWMGAVAVHELGHLVGGWAVGGRFLLWVVGPLMVRRTPSGVRAGWNRSVNLMGGLAACIPREPHLATPRRTAVMIVGGPLFSLLLAIVMGTAVWAVGRPAAPGVSLAVAQHVMVFTGGISLLIFLVTVLPMVVGGFKSDGRRVFDLLRGGRRSEQEAALLVLTTAGLAGVRPADYDATLVARAVSLGDGSLFDLYGHVTVYYAAADRGDNVAAQEHLDRALAREQRLVPWVRGVVRCEYAWLLAMRGGTPACARSWFESAGPVEFEPATRLRAEAAVLLAEGRTTEAEALAREGLVALERRTLAAAVSPFAFGALQEILRRCRAGAASQAL